VLEVLEKGRENGKKSQTQKKVIMEKENQNNEIRQNES
jgi:hypothetical protein